MIGIGRGNGTDLRCRVNVEGEKFDINFGSSYNCKVKEEVIVTVISLILYQFLVFITAEIDLSEDWCKEQILQESRDDFRMDIAIFS